MVQDERTQGQAALPLVENPVFIKKQSNIRSSEHVALFRAERAEQQPVGYPPCHHGHFLYLSPGVQLGGAQAEEGTRTSATFARQAESDREFLENEEFWLMDFFLTGRSVAGGEHRASRQRTSRWGPKRGI